MTDSTILHSDTHHRLAAVPPTPSHTWRQYFCNTSGHWTCDDSAKSLRFLDVTKIPSKTSITSMCCYSSTRSPGHRPDDGRDGRLALRGLPGERLARHLRTSEVVTSSLALPAPQCAETDVGPALPIKSCNSSHSPKTATAAAPQLAAFRTRNEST